MYEDIAKNPATAAVMEDRCANGWIFSPTHDFVVFWLTLALVLLVYRSDVSRTLLFGYALAISIDMAHVVATIFPLNERRLRGKLRTVPFFAAAVLSPAAGVALYAYSKVLFVALLATAALFHVVRQQYGLVMMSRRNAGETDDRTLDTLALLNAVAFPVLWWLSASSGVAKKYFYPDDLAFTTAFVPAALVSAALIVHWLFNAFYVFSVFAKFHRGAAVNFAKISLLASTWAWFYGCLVLLKSRDGFFYALILTHGLSYIFVSLRAATSSPFSLLSTLPPRRLAIMLALSMAWFSFAYAVGMPLPMESNRLVEPLVLSPLIAHYGFDAFIWKRSMFADGGV